jgi:hypothetical protein
MTATATTGMPPRHFDGLRCVARDKVGEMPGAAADS